MSATQTMLGKVLCLSCLALCTALAAPPLEAATTLAIPATTLAPALGIQPLFDAVVEEVDKLEFQSVAAVPTVAPTTTTTTSTSTTTTRSTTTTTTTSTTTTIISTTTTTTTAPEHVPTSAAPSVAPAFVRSEPTPAPPPQQLTSRERQALIGHLDGNFDQIAIVLSDKQRLAIFQERSFRSQGFGAFSPASDANNQEQPRQSQQQFGAQQQSQFRTQQNQQFSPQSQQRQRFPPPQQS